MSLAETLKQAARCRSGPCPWGPGLVSHDASWTCLHADDSLNTLTFSLILDTKGPGWSRMWSGKSTRQSGISGCAVHLAVRLLWVQQGSLWSGPPESAVGRRGAHSWAAAPSAGNTASTRAHPTSDGCHLPCGRTATQGISNKTFNFYFFILKSVHHALTPPHVWSVHLWKCRKLWTTLYSSDLLKRGTVKGLLTINILPVRLS